MKRRLLDLAALLALLLALAGFGLGASAVFAAETRAELQVSTAPAVVSYQGYVTVNGAPYSGTGYFKFAVVDSAGTTSYWSNDGTSSGGSEPGAAAVYGVTNGLFSALLGEAPMPGLSGGAFNGSERRLRTWFSSDGVTFMLLTPDRKIASVPYALRAEEAGNAGTLDGLDSLNFAASTHNHDIAYVNDNTNEVDDADISAESLSADRISGVAWTASNDGEDSGLDADLLDGLNSRDFAPLGHDHDSVYAALGHDHDELYAALAHTHAEYALAAHNHDSAYVNDNANEVGDADISVGSLSANRISGTAWTASNDGAGSGLDADSLDGQHGSYYQRRASGTCAVGSTVRLVNADGSVVCEGHDTRPGFAITDLDFSVAVVGLYTSITIGADGLGLISYFDETNDDLKVVHCSNSACTSATFATLDSAGNVGLYTSITIGADGLGLISYLDWTNYDLKVAHCSDTACTSATLATLDSVGDVGWYSSVTIGADGMGLISYYDSSNGNLKVAHCNDTICTSATLTTLDSAGVVGSYSSITIGADGLGLISYYDSTNGNLKVAHCSDTACTSATLTTLDSAGTVGHYTSITIGADGLGLISYYDQTNTSLKVAHCNDTACGAAAISSVDSDGNVGWETAMTIGADGLGLVSYYDVTNTALKVAHCNDTACSAATLATLDSVGSVGFYTSITIGADGLGLISYYDSSFGNLKVVHLSNALGTPWTRRR